MSVGCVLFIIFCTIFVAGYLMYVGAGIRYAVSKENRGELPDDFYYDVSFTFGNIGFIGGIITFLTTWVF